MTELTARQEELLDEFASALMGEKSLAKILLSAARS